MPGLLDRRILVTATVCALAAVAVTLLLLRPRPVEVVAGPADTSAACVAAREHWPATVAGQERRDDVVGARSATAWGSPAIIARCGLAPQPPSADQCIDVSGTDWVVQPLTDGTRLTSYGTDPAIEVLVPERYAPAPLRVGVFADAVRSLPSTGRRCT
ncbi:DUF3515 family protein [Arsenicicoccus bolidensis]|uniref:DUF3515 family protein n=1 Tax=Arsenicicoccus bolidensis TaxID=229480 RepID=A0ABS9Q1R4_9MICO|nr:DUF3515 family protein [Arsenicicoccus bolidensis]MCG7321230.1 DUF3515 family protein [Arsenicicoccus bolidensis]